MKTSQIIAATVMALVGASAMAGTPSYIADKADLFAQEAQAAKAANLTRAQAMAASKASPDEADMFANVKPSAMSRAQVRAAAAQADASLNFVTNPVYTNAMVAPSDVTRAQVRANTIATLRAERSGS